MDGKLELVKFEEGCQGSVGLTIADWSLQELVDERGFG